MRSHWRYRLAGITAAVAVALAVGPASLVVATTAQAAVAHPLDCPAGTHWNDVLNSCV